MLVLGQLSIPNQGGEGFASVLGGEDQLGATWTQPRQFLDAIHLAQSYYGVDFPMELLKFIMGKIFYYQCFLGQYHPHSSTLSTLAKGLYLTPVEQGLHLLLKEHLRLQTVHHRFVLSDVVFIQHSHLTIL